MLEIEIKASLGDLEKEQIKNLAEIMNFKYSKTLHETDIYFNGNDRNFAKTDEALRLRSCEELSKKPHSKNRKKTLLHLLLTKDLNWMKIPAPGRNTKRQ